MKYAHTGSGGKKKIRSWMRRRYSIGSFVLQLSEKSQKNAPTKTESIDAPPKRHTSSGEREIFVSPYI